MCNLMKVMKVTTKKEEKEELNKNTETSLKKRKRNFFWQSRLPASGSTDA